MLEKQSTSGMSSRLLEIDIQIMVMAIVISFVLLFLGMGMAVLVMIQVCIVGRAFQRGFGTDDTRGERCRSASNGLSPHDLEKLPRYDYKVEEDGSSPVDCAVCLESFQMGDRCRFLPACKHSFHAQCADSWLLRTPICPICRTSADPRKAWVEISVSGDESPAHASTSA